MSKFFILTLIFTSACARSNKTCVSYPSPYDIRYPQDAIIKSDVAKCDGYYIATSLESDMPVEYSASTLIVRLEKTNPVSGSVTAYLTDFSGQ